MTSVCVGASNSLPSLHSLSVTRWSCTQATGPTRTTIHPWRVESTSTQQIPKTVMPPSTWRGWNHQTQAPTNAKWRRLPASAAGRCCWSSWVSGTVATAGQTTDTADVCPAFFFSSQGKFFLSTQWKCTKSHALCPPWLFWCNPF